MRLATILVAVCCMALFAHVALADPPTNAASTSPEPKKAFAHYMGCFPAAAGPIYLGLQEQAHSFQHESQDKAICRGGHIRNWPLAPDDAHLTLEQAADLEIRRAMRIGIDGFTVDAWAGSKDARAMLDAMFKVAEEKDYPFELTITPDPCCLGPQSVVDAIKELLAKHGKSPKLARRHGKPLIFGYMSVCFSMQYAYLITDKHPELKSKSADELGQWLRTTPEGWEIMAEAYEQIPILVGQPLDMEYCLSWWGMNTDQSKAPKDLDIQIAGILAKHGFAVGSFQWMGMHQPQMAEAVLANGGEWSGPTGMFQKENIPYETYGGVCTDWLRGNLTSIRTQNATLLQIITWNDYGENTNIAPGWNTRYTVYDLTGYYLKWWKTGKEPEPDHDRIYLTYYKYPHGAKTFPFRSGADLADKELEVLTILPRPATIRLPGRNAEYEAPAGLFVKRFPLTPGPVVADLIRGGKTEIHLESPEPVTSRPFREDNGIVCFSTEFMNHWKADFGDAKPFLYSEYGDEDHDGLPNWFEMYWFSKERGFTPPVDHSSIDGMMDEIGGSKDMFKYSKWFDFSTQTYADPKADLNGNGKTNLQKYLDQEDPTRKPAPAKPE